MPPSLSAHAVSCVRGGKPIFDEVSFSADRGEVVQVAGPNGSGKTSLLRILAGLAAPESGTVTWCGEPLSFPVAGDYRRESCYTGHRNAVAADLTALENLDYAAILRAGSGACSPAAALEQLGLSARSKIPTRKLSAGQRQRIALARLLVSGASLWLLDEPFTALDSDGKRRCETLLKQHCEGGGIAVVATHQPIDDPALPVKSLLLGEAAVLD